MNSALPKVRELYRRGAVKPIEDVSSAGKRAPGPAAGGAPGGRSDQSACSAADLRKAIAAGDEAFLRKIANKPVMVEGMVLRPPKPQGDLALAEIMVAGGAVPVAFPLDTRAAFLPMAARVVVKGEAARASGRWLVRASAWGKAEDVSSGRPLNVCVWPDAGSLPFGSGRGPEEDAGLGE